MARRFCTLLGQGADHTLLGDGHVPDRICPDRPLLLMAFDFRAGFANADALRVAGLRCGRALAPGRRSGDGRRRAV